MHNFRLVLTLLLIVPVSFVLAVDFDDAVAIAPVPGVAKERFIERTHLVHVFGVKDQAAQRGRRHRRLLSVDARRDFCGRAHGAALV